MPPTLPLGIASCFMMMVLMRLLAGLSPSPTELSRSGLIGRHGDRRERPRTAEPRCLRRRRAPPPLRHWTSDFLATTLAEPRLAVCDVDRLRASARATLPCWRRGQRLRLCLPRARGLPLRPDERLSPPTARPGRARSRRSAARTVLRRGRRGGISLVDHPPTKCLRRISAHSSTDRESPPSFLRNHLRTVKLLTAALTPPIGIVAAH